MQPRCFSAFLLPVLILPSGGFGSVRTLTPADTKASLRAMMDLPRFHLSFGLEGNGEEWFVNGNSSARKALSLLGR